MRPPIAWVGEAADGHLELLDQTLLPAQEVVLELRDIGGVIDAIQRLAVRGAPAIGVAAGYGVVLGVRHAGACDPAELIRTLGAVCDELGAARPTAVNLQWAVQRMRERGKREPDLAALLDEAHAIHQQDAALCLQIGAHGAALVRDGMTVLTHCNAGRLATAGDGTALAVLYAAWATGTRFRVLADETRPLLQGARLTALELHDA
ncbi:MAG: S-methyl-5-thioribose-1-phosphate isomerase, partial [Planctomycetes bacterium]|nr:S-methyl-5-thioribose-1-phosphate isomerase [Planctomycetota bacterium]